MDVIFEDSKTCNAFKNFVLDPSDRAAQKAFRKYFDIKIESSSIRLFDKIISSANASIYNTVCGHNNKFELVSGCRKKDEQKFKVRIDQDYRKFFYFILNGAYCLVELWGGDFKQIESICVYDVNNHKYD